MLSSTRWPSTAPSFDPASCAYAQAIAGAIPNFYPCCAISTLCNGLTISARLPALAVSSMPDQNRAEGILAVPFG